MSILYRIKLFIQKTKTIPKHFISQKTNKYCIHFLQFNFVLLIVDKNGHLTFKITSYCTKLKVTSGGLIRWRLSYSDIDSILNSKQSESALQTKNKINFHQSLYSCNGLILSLSDFKNLIKYSGPTELHNLTFVQILLK